MQNELTGEHTCIMLRALDASDLETSAAEGWLTGYTSDFRRRFISLLAYQFQAFSPSLALQLLEAPGAKTGSPVVTKGV